MFDKIADFIMKHSKAILIFWIVLLLCAVPFALKSGSVMSYDLNDMAGDDSESIQGLKVIATYFPSSGSDSSSLPLIVVQFSDQQGYENTNAFADYLNQTLPNDEEWKNKISNFVLVPSKYSGTGTSIELIGVIYSDHSIDVVNDTPNLRSYISSKVSQFSESIGAPAGFITYLTGMPAISYDMSKNAMSDLERIDPFTVFLILILVGLFFRSFITSATPPVTIGFAFVVVLAIIFVIGSMTSVFFITEMMLLVSMMGAGCDYCIFIISRYREELRSGKEHHEALRESIIWAGESIATSAASVIIGFGAMSICSYSLVSMMGICLAVGIIVALFAALTLIPSVLNLVGDKIFWPSTMKAFQEGGKATRGWYAWFGNLGKKYFHASAVASKKFAIPIVIVAILVTIPAAYMTLNNQTSYNMIGAMQSGDSGAGMDALGKYGNEGVLMPDYAVLEYEVPIAYITYLDLGESRMGLLFWNSAFNFDSLDGLTNKISNIDDNVASVTSYFNWEKTYASVKTPEMTSYEAIEKIEIMLQEQGNNTYVFALKTIINTLYENGLSYDFIVSLYPLIDYAVNGMTGTLGGDFVQNIKSQTAPPADVQEDIGLWAWIMKNFMGYDVDTTPYGAQYIKVSMATHEAAMAPTSMNTISELKTIVSGYTSDKTNLVVGSWVTGTAVVMFDVSEKISGEFKMIEILVIVLIIILLFVVMKSYTIPFRSVLTILMSISWTIALTHIVFVNILGGEVSWLVPLILLVICLGLGMDYDILLTTRIKENVLKGESNDDAIYHAVMHTGSVITICGLIMGGAFGTLMLSSMEMMQEFGFALCFAILVDALVVRTYIVPAVMHLLGDWNWKGPKFLKSKM